MSVQELESAVSQLSSIELEEFARWFEEYFADAWDKEIEADIKAGKLDQLGKKGYEQFESGGARHQRGMGILPMRGAREGE